jgi:hypothetical protein
MALFAVLTPFTPTFASFAILFAATSGTTSAVLKNMWQNAALIALNWTRLDAFKPLNSLKIKLK